MNQLNEMRRTYLKSALLFVAAIAVLVALFIITIKAFDLSPKAEAQPEAEPGRIVALVEDKGVFYMEPDLMVYCKQPPTPDQWNIIQEDGTINQDEVLKYVASLQKWSDCATEYASIVRAYADATIMLRNTVEESAKSFFMEFVEPSEEVSPSDDIHDHPGTF